MHSAKSLAMPALFTLTLASPAAAQPCQPMWSPDVDAVAINGGVRALLTVDAGAVVSPGLYVGGAFTNINAAPYSRIALWDGLAWSSLGPGLNDQAFTLHLHQGELVAAGRFTTAGLIAASRVSVWDGSAWSALGAGVNGAALALATFDDGAGPALIVGGLFTAAGGQTARGVAQWRDGQWSALGTGLQGGNRAALALAVYDDGTGSALYVGGSFLGAGGVASPNIARWDGQTWSAVGEGFNGAVNTLAQYNGDLIAGGEFTASGASPMGGLARWDGSAWSALTTGANGPIRALRVVNAPAVPMLVAAGAYTAIAGVVANNIAVFDGQTFSALGDGTAAAVRSVANFGDGWYVGTPITTDGGTPAQPLRRWDPCLSATPGDLNGDGAVDGADLASLLSQWGQSGAPADLNGDGVVNGADLATLLSNWGSG